MPRSNAPLHPLELGLRRLVKFVINHRGERSTIWRGFVFDRLSRWTPYLSVEAPSGTFLISTRDSVLGRMTFEQRGFEEDLMPRAIGLLREAGFKPEGTTFVDVGANIGTTTVQALSQFEFGRVVAIEPAAVNYRLLRANLVLNGLEEKVTLVKAAASDAPRPLDLGLSPTNSGDHRVVVTDTPGEFGEESWESSPVEGVTLDSLEIADPGLIWMDIQGFEARALAGAETLAKVPAVVEYWPYALQRCGDLERFHRLVADRYSTVFDLRSGERIPPDQVDRLKDSYRFSQTDLLLLP